MKSTYVFISIIALQGTFITYLLHKVFITNHLTTNVSPKNLYTFQYEIIKPDNHNEQIPKPFKNNTAYDGVAATLMLDSPQWFQRRYTAMISNIITNIPSTWAIQIFYINHGQSQHGLTINPGIKRLSNNSNDDFGNRIIFTPIPENITHSFGTKRKILYWTNSWIWEQMVSENVLVFSGNGVICSNSNLSMLDGSAMNLLFDKLDYIGTPWTMLWGKGGDGTISYRNRTAMIDAINFKPHDGNEREDLYFVKTLMQMNKESGTESYRIATKDQTNLFGGINQVTDVKDVMLPMVIVGTMPKLDHEVREEILFLCPEIKVIFPSLHHPSCFGAKPDGSECSKHICALKDPKERKGGC